MHWDQYCKASRRPPPPKATNWREDQRLPSLITCYNFALNTFYVPVDFFFFLATLQGLWDLSSPTRDWTHILCTGRQSLNVWTPGEVPLLVDLRDICLCFSFSFLFQVESPVRGWFPKGASQESYSGGTGEFLEGWKTDVHFMYTCTTHNRYLSQCLGFSQRASSPWVHVYVCDSIQNHTSHKIKTV